MHSIIPSTGLELNELIHGSTYLRITALWRLFGVRRVHGRDGVVFCLVHVHPQPLLPTRLRPSLHATSNAIALLGKCVLQVVAPRSVAGQRT